MRDLHASFCVDHTEGICQADDVTVGKWEIGLSAADREAAVYVWHPEILPDETSGILSPAEAIELGRALIKQGTRGLEQARQFALVAS